MNKPVLLLVDDHRAVLDALEAELTPAFAELCRIEAFDDARAVLEALPRWTEERRSIAVAIVDQKMPGMTGVELLAALRASVRAVEPTTGAAGSPEQAFTPARHTRAILLTGYAGLDSAMAAKNEGGVERYLEKPWETAVLHDAIATVLWDYALDSGAARHFVFRELVGAHELTSALRLRFEVYARTAGAQHVLPSFESVSQDADAFDRFSHHFGLFERTSTADVLVGTIRVSGAERTRFAPVLEDILPEGTALGERLRAERRVALPMLKYLVDREAVTALVAELRAAGEQVVEPGRLALHPGFRAGGDHGMRHLARHIIEGSVGFFFFFHRIMNALLTCVPLHAAFYRPYGFLPTRGTETRFTPGLQTLVACLHGRIDTVPEKTLARCEELGMRLKWNGGGAFVSARTTRTAWAARMAAVTSRSTTCGAPRSRSRDWNGRRPDAQERA